VKRALVRSALAVALVASPAYALPKIGDARPNVTLRDAWDRTLDLGRIGQRPLLLVYEDRDSSSHNQPLKDELSRIASGPSAGRVLLVAVADLQGYDYWPARGFVKDAVRSQSRALGAPIYCDWDGSLRVTLGLARGTSNVILYDAAGRVVFVHAGAMDAPTTERVMVLMRAMSRGAGQR
jgi:hypothetical protein